MTAPFVLFPNSAQKYYWIRVRHQFSVITLWKMLYLSIHFLSPSNHEKKSLIIAEDIRRMRARFKRCKQNFDVSVELWAIRYETSTLGFNLFG